MCFFCKMLTQSPYRDPHQPSKAELGNYWSLPQNEEFAQLMRQYLSTPEEPDDMLGHYQRQGNARHGRKVLFCVPLATG